MTIKNTGHEYLLRAQSGGGGSALQLWTHKMQARTFARNWQAEGCAGDAGVNAIILGSGVQARDGQSLFRIAGGGGNELNFGRSLSIRYRQWSCHHARCVRFSWSRWWIRYGRRYVFSPLLAPERKRILTLYRSWPARTEIWPRRRQHPAIPYCPRFRRSRCRQ